MLHHTVTGPPDTPPVLLLHGFMGSSADWRTVAEALTPAHRCISVDLPGHGRSLELDDEAYTMPGTTAALIEVLDHLGIDACSVVGYSMGGRTALYFALHAPERCRRLVLESASPGLPSPDERAARRGVDEARAVRLENSDYDAFLRDWYSQPLFASMAEHEGLVDRTLEARSSNDPAELARSLRGMGTGQQPSLWERLPELHVSTSAVAGTLDGKYVEIAERMAVRSTRIRSVLIPEAGHTIHAEHTGAFVDVLRRCLSEP